MPMLLAYIGVLLLAFQARRSWLLILRVLGLHRWPIFLADEGCQGDWLWDFGASGAGVKITSRDPMGATGSILLSGRVRVLNHPLGSDYASPLPST